MIQRERDMEGDEFKDKEAFVTQAYKDQMVELRKAEEEEKLREGTSCTHRPTSLSSLDIDCFNAQRLRRRKGRDLAVAWLSSTKSFSRKKPKRTKRQSPSPHLPRPTHRRVNNLKDQTSGS
jgi:hypothetical protein